MLKESLLLLLLATVIVNTRQIPLNTQNKGVPTKVHKVLEKILANSVNEIEKPQQLLKSAKPVAEDDDKYRIVDAIAPTHYSLEYKTFYLDEAEKEEQKFTFTGHVDIDFKVTKEIDEFQFHAVELVLSEIKLISADTEEGEKGVIKVTATNEKDLQYYKVKLDDGKKLSTKTEKYTLSMDFSGKINDKKQGIFRAKYTTKDKGDQWVAATYFAPTYARQAFPCFDEPAMKAEFDISITVDKNYKVFGNTDIKGNNRIGRASDVIAFETTPVMSTYLVAFAVGDFKSVPEKKTDGITSIVAHNSIENLETQTTQSLSDGVNSLKVLGDVTALPYTALLKKMDHIEIESPMTGAMENVGLITYQKESLVYNPDEISAEERQKKGILMAHELTHQWFGDLVTPKWWNEAWLSEGFASYLSYKIYDSVQSKWEILSQFGLQVRQEAFTHDALDSAVAMNEAVNSPSDAANKFTGEKKYATYSKAASVLYMIENIIGDEVFKTGLRDYLKQSQQKSVTADDLWTYVDKAVTDNKIKLNHKVKDIAESWYVAGYPLVQVSFAKGDKQMKLSQKLFRVDENGKIQDTKDTEPKWIVPVSLITSGSSEDVVKTPPENWINGNEESTIKVSDDTKWVLINNQQTGYYRVTYDEENWKAIARYLAGDSNDDTDSFLYEVETFLGAKKKNLELSDQTKLQLLDDAIILANGDALSYVIPLELTRMLESVKTFVPWKYVLNSPYTQVLLNKIKMTPSVDDMKLYMSGLIDGIYGVTKLEAKSKDKHTTKMLRDDVAMFAALSNNEKMMKDAVKIMERIKKDEDVKLSERVRIATYCAAVASNNEYSEFLLERYENETSDTSAILFGLACNQDEESLTTLLGDVLDGKTLKENDKKTFIHHLASVNPKLNFNYLVTNYDKYKSAFPKHDDLKGIITVSVMYLGTTEQLNQLTGLADSQKSKNDDDDDIFDDAVKQAQANVKWNEDHVEVHDWIESRFNHSSTTSAETSSVTEPTIESTTPDAASSIQFSIYLIALILSSIYFLN